MAQVIAGAYPGQKPAKPGTPTFTSPRAAAVKRAKTHKMPDGSTMKGARHPKGGY